MHHERKAALLPLAGAPSSDADEVMRRRLPERPHPVDREIGALIRKARRSAGLSQVELADAVGFPQSAVSILESGEQSLRARDLGPVAAALGVPVAELLPARRTER